MPVASTTVGGVNCWQFSGAVTDAEIRTAWAALIVNQEYVPARAIYLDSTCDLTAVQGGFFVNINFATVAFILHASRDKTKTVFRNWNFRQTAGISVGNRTLSCQSWNGTTLSPLSGSSTNNDGLDMFAGSFTYAVAGNPGGGDPRYLDEFAFGTLDGGTLITSSAFTEQELQPDIRGPRELKGVVFVRCFGFPQATGTFSRIVMWRCSQNSMHPTQRLVRAYAGANICYIDSTLRRNNAPVANPFIDTFGGSVTNLLVLNGYLDETWFGASKTAFLAITGWNASSTLRGGIFKRFQFVGAGANGTVKVYDSRSTTTPARSTFVGTAAADFLAAGTGTQTDSEGKVQIVAIGAQMNSNLSIVRYTGQKYTYQQFGKRVTVTDIDMTKGGDNDLSAYSPVILEDQEGLVRTQAEINAATEITTYRQLLEELHVMAIGLSGASSYGAAYEGNHFDYTGISLLTDFTIVNVNPLAAQKIAYDLATDTLTVKASSLTGGTAVAQWRNPGGKINLLNGATITGVYEDSDGQRATVTGLDPEGFGITWFLRYRLQGTTTWTEITGTGNTALILLAEGTYDVQVRAPGYEWESALVLDTTISLSLNAGLRYQVSSNNTPQYTMTYDAVLEAIFQYDATAMKVSVSNTTTGILQPGFAELYRATQRIQHIPALVLVWTAPVTANATSQKILIPSGNPISMFLTDVSTNTVKITCPVIHADTGQSADDRVRGNPSGYSIILGSPATAESAGLASQIISGLGGPNYETGEHSLSVIKADQDLAKAVLDLVKTAVDAIKPRTDLIPDQPAAVGSAMTLTGAYDAAKTAATQTSVDATAADVTSIKATVEAIEPTDLSGIPAAVRTELSTELGRIDVAVSTRSTLTAEDVPEGLTAAEVWSATTRTLTEAPGLPTGQAEQLRKVAQLHGVGVDLVVTETSRTAGDVSQTLTTDEAGSTTVSAA